MATRAGGDELLDPAGAAVMVRACVRNEHVLDVVGVEAQFTDTVQHIIDGFAKRGVNQHEAFARRDENRGERLQADRVHIVEELGRLPRLILELGASLLRPQDHVPLKTLTAGAKALLRRGVLP